MEAPVLINSSRSQAAPDVAFDAYIKELRSQYSPDKNITLIHCPNFAIETFSAEVARRAGYYAYPPTGLQCLKASLESVGIKAQILDLNYLVLKRVCSSQDDAPHVTALIDTILEEHFSNNAVSLVGVSAGVIVSNIFGVQNHPFVQVLRYLKKQAKQIVFTGGVIATNEWGNLLKKKLCHMVIGGEAENKLPYVIQSLCGEHPVKRYAGIHFSNQQRLYESTGEHDTVNFNWDLLPTYKDVPVEHYHTVGSLGPFSRLVGTNTPYATVQLNRGCRGRCTFCGVIPFMGKGVRQYPVAAVYSEIEYLVKERGIRHIEWLDDDLMKYPDSIKGLLRQIRDAQLPITWAANNGLIAAAVDDESLQLMVETGCVGFRIGIESGNEEMLKKIRKPATTKSLLAASTRFKKYPEIFVVGCYIIGFENETYQQILDTFQFSIRMDLGWNGFSVFQTLRDSANALEEFGNSSEEDSDENYEKIINFVPSKEGTKGEMKPAKTLDVRDLFAGDRSIVHDRIHLDEIWFAFNFLSNYACNINLRPGGNPKNFVQWVTSLQMTHPNNPVMSLFIALGHVLCGDHKSAAEQQTLTHTIVSGSKYWQGRFEQYGLTRLYEHPPHHAEEIYAALEEIRAEFASILSSESEMIHRIPSSSDTLTA